MKSTAITTQQLASLADLSPSFFTLHRADLGLETFTVQSGNPRGGRPAVAYSLEDIARFILANTSMLSDIECRLRVALSKPRRTSMKNLGLLTLIEDVDGNHVVIPEGQILSELPSDLAVKVRSTIASKHADTRAKRCARRGQGSPDGRSAKAELHQTRKPTVHEGESQ